jgi:predicted nucleotidyltransferase component of viral defense system
MDIDLLGKLKNSPETIAAVFRSVCNLAVEPDGLSFDPANMETQRIAEDADYEGIRVRVRGSLGNARITVQIDIGFADVVFPKPSQVEYPTILDMPAPKLQGYSRESAIAEKFEAMTKLGILNSRMKDFYDIWLLARQFDFDGKTLTKAIEGTFAHRETELSATPVAITAAFAEDRTKQTQWRAFVRKSRILDAPAELSGVVEALSAFLGPIAAVLAAGKPFAMMWKAPGPWT